MSERELREAGIRFERDVAVPMRDGTQLSANVFRPADGKRAPVLLSVTPYGKDKLPDRIGNFFMWRAGVRFGDIRISRYTGFEAPDPFHWVRAGYAVMQADVRGMHKSEGRAGVLSLQDAADYYDLIEWTGEQGWCDGGVALSGVSYLAMSQWRGSHHCSRRISRRSYRGKASATSIANSPSRAAFPRPASFRSVEEPHDARPQ